MNPQQHERYVRWQNYRITQLSYAINLFLGFAVASLAYVINLKLEPNAHNNIPLETVIILFAFSALFGCFSTISRLLDYRHTASKIKDGGRFNAFMAKYCGDVTWGCFWGQVAAYACGAYLFINGAVIT
ncbi:MAG: hypothetical protein K8I82_05250 [Anaerolineae bacterium]|nr:hypothetical protein [Anaerolineae bacterium]